MIHRAAVRGGTHHHCCHREFMKESIMKLFPALVCILAILSTDAAGQPTISVSPAGGGYCDTPTICACGLSGCN